MSKLFYVTGRNASQPLSGETNTSFASFSESLGLSTDHFESGRSLFVALDLDRRTIRELDKAKVPKSDAVLLRFEPEVVCPDNYKRKNLRKFQTIVDFGRTRHDSTYKEFWPQNWQIVSTPSARAGSQGRRGDAAIINANKLSLIRGELYSLRRSVIHSADVDVYGPAWDSSILRRMRILLGEMLIAAHSWSPISSRALRYWLSDHPNVMGTSRSKAETLSQYRCSVVIENSQDYMSEKLIDALLAGCIPVYVGPKCSNFGLPPGLVIECEPNALSIHQGIDAALSVDYNLWLQARDAYLHSSDTMKNWSAEQVFQRVIRNISK